MRRALSEGIVTSQSDIRWRFYICSYNAHVNSNETSCVVQGHEISKVQSMLTVMFSVHIFGEWRIQAMLLNRDSIGTYQGCLERFLKAY